MTGGPRLAFAVCVLAIARSVAGQPVTAIVAVNVVPMDGERLLANHTVIVEGERIAAIGPADAVSIPGDATIVDGRGRFLAPGLVDAHVHLADLPWARNRPDFGDAPLYLAYGITTVINLGGSPIELDWRQRVRAGELVGPTIYTAGPFVSEPRVTTAEEVARDIRAQAAAGYDLIKFHELPGTTRGLTLEAYRAMIGTAREVGLPVVGHAPVNLGVDALLAAGQPVAHVGNLNNIHFFPMLSNLPLVVTTAASFVALALTTVVCFAVGFLRRERETVGSDGTVARLRGWLYVATAASVLSAVALGLVLPGGRLFDSLTVRVIASLCTAVVLIAAAAGFRAAYDHLRKRTASAGGRMAMIMAALAVATFAATLALFWLPLAWRASEPGMERFAAQLRGAGISVQSTLVVYELFSGNGHADLQQDAAIEYLHPATRAEWRRLPPSAPPFADLGGFMRRLTGVLHRGGVEIVAGTDAMGMPLITPGTSLHRELELLRRSGMSPYEALRAATVAPARFLRKEHEFGTISVGKRADLLLVGGNPLENPKTLSESFAVMVRGRWHTRDELLRRLRSLATQG